MTKQVHRVAVVVLALFVALAANLNFIQVIRADEYRSRDANRQLAKDYGVRRGSILAADGTLELARSVDTGGQLRFDREYPQGPLYAHITGYLSPVFGRTQLERSENDTLDAEGNAIETFADLLADREPTGDSVVATIRPNVQQAAESALGPRRGAIAALNPGTGEVLALWSFPTYDPNALASFDDPAVRAAWDQLEADPSNPRLNRAASELYAPGSTFKIITAAAALEAGLPEDRQFDDPPGFQLPGTQTVIPNFGGSLCNGGNPLTLADALRVSCNTTFLRLGTEFADEIVEQARAFGFTTLLGEQIPELAPSHVTQEGVERLDPASAAQAAIGQLDVRVTPLQMAAAAGAIGMDGTLNAPRLVNSIQDYGGATIDNLEPARIGQAVSPGTARTLTDMMVSVVENGTARQARVPGVRVAGKTGTAQRGVDPATGVERNPNVWFVGFAPAENPTVAIAVIVEDGGDVGSEATGGAIAAPIGRAVIQAALQQG